MKIFKRIPALLGIFALSVAMTVGVVDSADARKGGSIGSRGARTYQAPPTTPTAPTTAQPIQRSMTSPSAAQPAAGAAATAGRSGFLGGMGGSLLTGLALGGLVGMLMGNGLGGMSGFLGLLLQAGLIALAVMVVLRLLAARRQQAPVPAGAGAPFPNGMARDNMFGGSQGGSGPAPQGAAPRSALGGIGPNGYQAGPARKVKDEVGIRPADFDAFERLLGEVQDAFGREDYGALRERSTPEVMSFLSEELSQNATQGQRNHVSDVKLLQGDLAEAWREGNVEYATLAMRYEMRDSMRNRETGALMPDSSEDLAQTTELWTFTRPRGGTWKLSAIQDT